MICSTNARIRRIFVHLIMEALNYIEYPVELYICPKFKKYARFHPSTSYYFLFTLLITITACKQPAKSEDHSAHAPHATPTKTSATPKVTEAYADSVNLRLVTDTIKSSPVRQTMTMLNGNHIHQIRLAGRAWAYDLGWFGGLRRGMVNGRA